MHSQKILILLSVLTLLGCKTNIDNPRSVMCINDNWRFSLSADSNAVAIDFNDADWRTLDLPHDWSIEGNFAEDNPSTPGCGALPGGYGVYRKKLFLDNEDSAKQIFIHFDGVYWQSTVYVNGKKAGYRPNGYVSFEYDITPLVNFGEDNVIAVTVDNTNLPNSRWYSGSGIYRNVYLKKLDKHHIDESDIFIYSTGAKSDTINIKVDFPIQNNDETSITIYNPHGLKQFTNTFSNDSGYSITISTPMTNPIYWSPDHPALYRAEIITRHNGKITDVLNIPFGIRYFKFDPDNGFTLNGKSMKINGVCLHHDLGALGAAVNRRALERQLQILKDMGCNAIRTSHNPPAPELLNLCDSMGFIVMDEAFDMWAKKKTVHDYSQHFAQWHEQDLTDFIKRDRNHPSVIMWSIGNEILEQWHDINTDTLDIAQANLMFNFAAQISQDNTQSDSMHVNSLLAKKLAQMVRSIDPTRPVTSGNNETEPTNLIFRSGAMDIIGFNYHEYNWGEKFRQKFPGKPLIITESTSALQTRDEYIFPADTQYLWPERWDKPFFRSGNQCSAYDNVRAPWGSTHETTLKEYMKYPWVSGIFVWTGFDYIGEPTPYGWPSRSSYFGIVDLAGFPKDVYYLYQSQWTDKDVLHILPHWNWNAGDNIAVWAYTNADEVELFLNNTSLGVRKKSDTDALHLSWNVEYAPGTLVAVGKKDGRTFTDTVRTSSDPAKIIATPDRKTIKADGKDLCFITLDITDGNGVIAPNANNLIEFKVTGAATFVAADNGNPICHENFTKPIHSAFHGKCLCIIKSIKGQKGEITVTATSNGIKSAELKLKAE